MFSHLNPVSNYIHEVKVPTRKTSFGKCVSGETLMYRLAYKSSSGTSRSPSLSDYYSTVSRAEEGDFSRHRDSFALPPIKRQLHREIIFYFGSDPKVVGEFNQRSNLDGRIPGSTRLGSSGACRQMFRASTGRPRNRIFKKDIVLERAATFA